MTQLRWQTHLGFAKESGGWGVSFAQANTYVPVLAGAKFMDAPKYYYDEAFRSVQAKDFGAYQTTLQGNATFKTDVYIDTFPVLTGACMVGNNDVVTTVYQSSVLSTATGSCSAHTFLMTPNGPSSVSLYDYNGYTERVYQGTRFSQIQIKYAPDGSLQADYKGDSRLSVINASTANVQAATIGTNPPILAWQAFITLNNAQTFRVIDTEITLKRGLEVLFTQAGTQSPTNIYAFPLEVDGKCTFDFADEAEYNLFRTNNQSATFDILFASSGANGVRFTIPNPVWTSYEVDRGKDFLTAVLDFRGIYSAANSTNVKMIVFTSVTTPY